jgi:DNA-binding NarL/FixJ family response regulator
LAELPDVRSVECATGVAEAAADRRLTAANVILLDCELSGAADFARELSRTSRARVLLCSRRPSSSQLVSAAGTAAGVLAADSLTPEVVAASIRAISRGLAVLGLDLMHDLCRSRAMAARDDHTSDAPPPAVLSPREHAVLSLVADGVTSREIARQLAYSERTIKNVLHDVITKLGARSRSHAVAVAVREHII